MTGEEFLAVALYSGAIAVGVGALAWVVLRLIARAPLIAHILVIVIAAVLAVAGGIAIVANAMYISEHDVIVALAVTLTSGIVAVLMAIGLGLVLARSGRDLRRAARRLGNGESIEPAGAMSAEFGAVHRELIASSERLQLARRAAGKAEEARLDLVSRIAHDLMAPLASVRAMSEALEDGLAPDPDRYLRQISGQVDRLTALVGDLFVVSRIDAGSLALRPQRVSLSDLASDVVAEYSELARARGVSLELDSRAAVTVRVDPREMTRVIVNLVTNGIQHSPAGSTVAVRVDGGVGTATLSVSDGGDGIHADDISHVFEAGWRADAARTPADGDSGALSGGAGLGLAIARGIVDAHGGRIDVENTSRGARFTVTLVETAD